MSLLIPSSIRQPVGQGGAGRRADESIQRTGTDSEFLQPRYPWLVVTCHLCRRIAGDWDRAWSPGCAPQILVACICAAGQGREGASHLISPSPLPPTGPGVLLPHPCSAPRRHGTGCGKKAVPAPHHLPRQLPSHLLGSQLRQWLPWGERHLYAIPALGPLRDGFLALLPWGTCLILGLPKVVLSHLRGMGLVTGELQGDKAPVSGLLMCD